MTTTMTELGLAYRKAKVDLYYSSHPDLAAIVEYERSLSENLTNLQSRLNGSDEGWVASEAFLGSWTLAAKGVGVPDKTAHSSTNGRLIFSAPKEEWLAGCAASNSNVMPEAEFRLMARPSVDFHVVSALWIMKVGQYFDSNLGKCAYGSRLRRGRNDAFNLLSLGSFKPYLKPYREWRDDGIRVTRSALEEGKSVIALTADVTSFYHLLSPQFMLSEKFKSMLDLPLGEDAVKIHRLFIVALQEWARRTPLDRGLPVGVPASAVVANMALVELDRIIEREMAPLYYGRYVDDIMLVMENSGNFSSTAEVWDWILARADGLLVRVGEIGKSEIAFCPQYLSDCEIRFQNGKNKVFRLDGVSGLAMIGSIESQINERASEWRALPDIPESAAKIGTDLVIASQRDGQIVDSLRKADILSMRRSGFALKLRDFEAYERDLPPAEWAQHRHAFLDAFIEHVIVLPHFFELEGYLSRVVRLAVACEDFEHLARIIEKLSALVANVESLCTPKIKSAPPGVYGSGLVARWRSELDHSIFQAVVSAFPPRISKPGRVAWEANIARPGLDIGKHSVGELQARHAEWFACDLAHSPLRFSMLPSGVSDGRGVPARKWVQPRSATSALLPDDVLEGIVQLSRWVGFGSRVPSGLFYATRPFSLPELFLLAPDAFSASTQDPLRKVILALRGFSLKEKTPTWDVDKGTLRIEDGEQSSKRTVAVSSWKTDAASWVAAVTRKPDPHGRDRYQRLTRLLNGIISQPRGANYLLLPELSMPARWFLRFAQKLRGRGIALISGIEYIHAGRGRVRNQVWAALSHDGLGFPSLLVYRQDKQRPALHEERELHRVAGLKLAPERAWRSPPVVEHGGFSFGLLVCSELTNISYKASLRGRVDALFVPEWNQDTETFSSLVESAALDVHAYVVQSNDRQYGDSRIRGPYRDSWKRDVLRVKGGVTDYCVTGEIDIGALRRFQSSYRSPEGPYKPVPDGFRIGFDRSALPEMDTE